MNSLLYPLSPEIRGSELGSRFFRLGTIALQLCFVLTTCLLLMPASDAAEVTGVPRVVDGDTLVIGSVTIRLDGIDAPETDQMCASSSEIKWQCGIEARDRLRIMIGEKSIMCRISGRDRYRRELATCFLGTTNINRWLVVNGWALSFVRYSHAYDSDERLAREKNVGLWAGAFIQPWEWRARPGKSQILGARQNSPVSRNIVQQVEISSDAPSPECPIKGNVNRQGGKIYHEPGMRDYGKVIMEHHLEKRWFCSALEAEAAGWRRAKR